VRGDLTCHISSGGQTLLRPFLFVRYIALSPFSIRASSESVVLINSLYPFINFTFRTISSKII